MSSNNNLGSPDLIHNECDLGLHIKTEPPGDATSDLQTSTSSQQITIKLEPVHNEDMDAFQDISWEAVSIEDPDTELSDDAGDDQHDSTSPQQITINMIKSEPVPSDEDMDDGHMEAEEDPNDPDWLIKEESYSCYSDDDDEVNNDSSENSEVEISSIAEDDPDDPEDQSTTKENYEVEYECKCEKIFSSIDALEQHLVNCIAGSKQNDSSVKTADTEPSDDKEGTKVADTKQQYVYKCDQCERTCKTKNGFWHHRKSYHTQKLKMFMCPVSGCEYRTHVCVAMKRHVQLRHTKDMPEDELKEYIYTRGSSHQKWKLMTNPDYISGTEKKYKRGPPQKILVSVPEVKDDSQSIFKMYNCPVSGCSRKSKIKRNIRAHLATHSELSSKKLVEYSVDIPFKHMLKSKSEVDTVDCKPTKGCGKTGTKSGQRKKIHQNKHEKYADNTATCPECNRVFKGVNCRTHLKSHKELIHMEMLDLFHCPVKQCCYKNIYAHKVKSHLVVKHAKHLTEEEYAHASKPDSIVKKTVRNPSFVSRTIFHTEVIPVKEEPEERKANLTCDICKEKFGTIDDPDAEEELNEHKKQKHMKRILCYFCPLESCDFVGKRTDAIKDHMRRHVKKGLMKETDLAKYAGAKNLKTKFLHFPEQKIAKR